MLQTEFLERFSAVLQLRGLSPEKQNAVVYQRAWEIVGKGRADAQIVASLTWLEERLDTRDMVTSFRKSLGAGGGEALELGGCTRCGGALYLPVLREKTDRLWLMSTPCSCCSGQTTLMNWEEKTWLERREAEESYPDWFRRDVGYLNSHYDPLIARDSALNWLLDIAAAVAKGDFDAEPSAEDRGWQGDLVPDLRAGRQPAPDGGGSGAAREPEPRQVPETSRPRVPVEPQSVDADASPADDTPAWLREPGSVLRRTGNAAPGRAKIHSRTTVTPDFDWGG